MSVSFDSIDPSIAELLDLFAGPLEGVSFPDVNAGALADLAQQVHSANAEVAEIRAMLEAAQASVEAAEHALLTRSQRALAYARVYATDDATLGAALARISLPHGPGHAPANQQLGALPPPADAPRKRGRPPKVRPGGGLFPAPVAAEGEAQAPPPIEH